MGRTPQLVRAARLPSILCKLPEPRVAVGLRLGDVMQRVVAVGVEGTAVSHEDERRQAGTGGEVGKRCSVQRGQ